MLIILLILTITVLTVFQGSTQKEASILMGVNCDPQSCSFLFKGTDEVLTLRLFANGVNLELNHVYSFYHSGNYTFPISLEPNTVLNYLLVMQKAGTISGSVIVN